MESMQEIETKIRGLLSVKKAKDFLTKEEEHIFKALDKKYRDEEGKLKKGSFFVNSEGEWEEVD